jgi:hypothetical protein
MDNTIGVYIWCLIILQFIIYFFNWNDELVIHSPTRHDACKSHPKLFSAKVALTTATTRVMLREVRCICYTKFVVACQLVHVYIAWGPQNKRNWNVHTQGIKYSWPWCGLHLECILIYFVPSCLISLIAYLHAGHLEIVWQYFTGSNFEVIFFFIYCGCMYTNIKFTWCYFTSMKFEDMIV